MTRMYEYIQRVEQFWDAQETYGFTTCQLCRHFTPWGNNSQECGVLLDRNNPINECPALTRLDMKEET